MIWGPNLRTNPPLNKIMNTSQHQIAFNKLSKYYPTDQDSDARRIHKIITAATYPDNYDFTTSTLITAPSICRKTFTHVQSKPSERPISPLSNCICLPNPEPLAWKYGAWKRQESQNKKIISPPLAVRDISNKFLCRSRILTHTTRHDLREALCPGFSSTFEGLHSLILPK